ncbi:MAG: ABC transporter permease [Aigarchaeota archaeon]|nr:ABC transporter permease [Candidatus Pelearchaeum maunauluense]
MSETSREAWRVFWSSNISKLGINLLAILVIVSLYVVFTYPLDFGLKYWNNPAHWVDYPKGVPPEWAKYFTSENVTEHRIYTLYVPSESRFVEAAGLYIKRYVITFDYQYDEFPSFLSFTVFNVTFNREPPIIFLEISRPDGVSARIYTLAVPGPQEGEKKPYMRYSETPFRVFLSGDPSVAQQLSRMLKRDFDISLTPTEINTIGPEKILFGEPDTGKNFTILKGVYRVDVVLASSDEKDSVGYVRFVVAGNVYGWVGTDSLGRDLAVGLLFGFPVALLIGVVTTTLTTAVGATAGIISGYVGGKTDDIIQRIADVINNIPLLPILIFLIFVLKPSIWLIVFLLVAFGWPGLTIIVRSMVLQLRTSQLVEAEVALGASKWRIMFRHIFPQIAPFIFAQMIFATPTAILAEAALSFLGLGDPSLPTWGQILNYGFRDGGVYVGYWWWIVPPGLLIVLTAITFVFLALGLEPVVNPRLRRFK